MIVSYNMEFWIVVYSIGYTSFRIVTKFILMTLHQMTMAKTSVHTISDLMASMRLLVTAICVLLLEFEGV